jgi:hypothetical protein
VRWSRSLADARIVAEDGHSPIPDTADTAVAHNLSDLIRSTKKTGRCSRGVEHLPWVVHRTRPEAGRDCRRRSRHMKSAMLATVLVKSIAHFFFFVAFLAAFFFLAMDVTSFLLVNLT